MNDMAPIDHNKLLKKIAKEQLEPFGIVQKGQSRTFLYDRGWYMILFIILVFGISGCYTRLDLRSKFYAYETHKIFNFNRKEILETTARLKKEYSEVLYFYSTDIDLSEKYTNSHLWFYGNNGFNHLHSLKENSKGKLKIREDLTFDNSIRLIEFIATNRIDTVESLPESGFYSSHPSHYFVEYFKQGDKLISYSMTNNRYTKKRGFMDSYGLVPETDIDYSRRMNHPRYLLGLEIFIELNAIEKNAND